MTFDWEARGAGIYMMGLVVYGIMSTPSITINLNRQGGPCEIIHLSTSLNLDLIGKK